MSKFKVGDEVVVVKAHYGIHSDNLKRLAVVLEVGGIYPFTKKSGIRVKPKESLYYHRNSEWIDEESFELINKDEVFYV